MKRVAIIGAGVSGLPCIRHAVLYGVEPVCFEVAEDLGGLWRFKPGETEYSTVMRSTIINTSKEMMAYSDFPPPANEANFMHHRHMLKYFENYADHFKLRQYIRFQTKVSSIRRADDYETSGRWNVTYKTPDGIEQTETFDGVLLAAGHHAKPNWPAPYPGQDRFKGRLIHSHDYKDAKGFEDKVVVAVGIGNSGVDVAVELSRVAEQVYLSTRRGAWIVNRVGDDGLPCDALMTRRYINDIFSKLPPAMINYYIQSKLNKRFNHQLYGLKPRHGYLSAHPTISDELPNRIISGTVRVKPNIREFTENGVVFDDGSVVEHVDAVVFSTGYQYSFPLLEDGTLIPVKENRSSEVYKYMYPLATADHNTLAIIGYVQQLGGLMPISEMEARVFFDVFTGNRRLPSKAEMIQDVEAKREAMRKRYVKSTRHTLQVDFIPFMDELAEIIGAQPNLKKLALSDPVLAKAVYFGPCVAYTYRLNGPHPWSGAREAILGVESRILQATSDQPLYSRDPLQMILYFAAFLAFLSYLFSMW